MLRQATSAQRWLWVGLLSVALLSACGGGAGGDQPGPAQAPKKLLSIQLNAPAQVRPGESLQLSGSLATDSALPDKMEWLLLERPSGSQAALGQTQSSSQLLRTDLAGRYVVQWTVTSADGQSVQRQAVVEAVNGPLIQTSASADRLQLGQSTLLQAVPTTATGEGLTSYRWTLLQGPSGSRAQLSGSWGQEVSLNADVAGQYQVQVEAHQGGTVSRSIRTLSATAAPSVTIYPTYVCGQVMGCNKVVGQPVTLTTRALGSLEGAKLDYRWTLVSSPPDSRLSRHIGNGPTVVLTPDVVGYYLIELTPTSSDLQVSGAMVGLQVVANKAVGSIQAPGTVNVGQLVTLDASGNRGIDGQPIIGTRHIWTLVQAPKGSSAVIDAGPWGDPVAKLTPDRPGDYVISLSFDDAPDFATVTVRAISADQAMLYPPKLVATLSPLVPGEEIQLRAESTSYVGHEIVHEWKFGDGTSTTGDSVTHRYAYPGVYQAQVVARDTVTQRIARQTFSVTVVASRLSNIPPAPCKEEPCPALAADSYAGKGLGRWLLVNEQPHPQVANIDIAGVPAGREVLVSLSNASALSGGRAELGQSEGVAPRPMPAAQAQAQTYQADRTLSLNSSLLKRDEAHAAHRALDRAVALALPGSASKAQARTGRRTIQSAVARQALPVPAIGSSRDWQNLGATGVYKSRLAASCGLTGGRQILFWLDEQVHSNELMDTGQIERDLLPMVCGEQGGFQKLQQLLGAEVFGLHERVDIISDAALQPVQILLADPGPNSYWGAYVYSGDLARKDFWPTSNEAVLMVVNARFLKSDLNFIKSSLIHEFMHQINNYQRWILNGWERHESWLEETTAMMAEDLVSSALITKADGSRYAALAMRMANYQSYVVPGTYLGGGGADYSIGGSLAGYLDRRLGAGLLRGLTFNCPDEGQTQGSLRCLDDQVFLLSGTSLSDHYGAMNASLIGPFNPADGAGLGMPAYVGSEVDLPAIDLKTLGISLREQLLPPWQLNAGSHVYQWESTTEAAGGRYRRKGIMVPPGHVLQIVIR
ncbi:PKD domain-containing protein [Pelomonas sp. SE-A7]|uniref:M30 family zinc metallopeptidase n=1 Tax=Pelomonas sp. SE-A7 TaxID=3054953 RepID=UPI00259CA51C|nr:PKD domain-containing protein [Pelomonas sp. SE-A7]MDM4766888.1 PKD domain-containing protein [Pelomonas sp. SE-A7]